MFSYLLYNLYMISITVLIKKYFASKPKKSKDIRRKNAMIQGCFDQFLSYCHYFDIFCEVYASHLEIT